MFYQDDILGCTQTEEAAELLRRAVCEHLIKCGVKVNEKKYDPPTKSITFCGISITGNELRPLWKKSNSLSDVAMSKFLEEFQNCNRTSAITWIRSLIGVFNFTSRWQGTKERDIIHSLRENISLLEKGLQVDRKAIGNSVLDLATFYFNGLIVLNTPWFDFISI